MGVPDVQPILAVVTVVHLFAATVLPLQIVDANLGPGLCCYSLKTSNPKRPKAPKALNPNPSCPSLMLRCVHELRPGCPSGDGSAGVAWVLMTRGIKLDQTLKP